MVLYSYWRSTTSLRVRAALNLKGLNYEVRPVNLVAGAQREPGFLEVNPGGGVPALVLEDGTVLRQSMAILDWLDETHPKPLLLPVDPVARAQVRAAAQVIAMDIHPVNNLKVGNHLKAMGHSQEDVVNWMRHWMHEGFTAFQAMIAPEGRYCFGEDLTQADLCLVGQMVNARRWGLDLAPFARLVEIDARVRDLPAVAAAMPQAQPDATP